MADSNPPDPRNKGGRLRLFPLIAATFFMVSGGPYGIEDTLGGAGYFGALLILVQHTEKFVQRPLSSVGRAQPW